MGLDIRDCDCTGYKRGELGQLKNINFLLLNQGLISAPDPSLHYLEVSGTPDVPPRMCQSVFEATHIPTLFYRIYCIVDFNMEKAQTCGTYCILSIVKDYPKRIVSLLPYLSIFVIVCVCALMDPEYSGWRGGVNMGQVGES